MLLLNIKRQARIETELAVYLRLLVRLSHIFWVVACGLLIAGVGVNRPWSSFGAALVEWWRPLLLSGYLMALSFEAFSLYGMEMFGRKLRLRPLVIACIVGFGLIFLVSDLSPSLQQLGPQRLGLWFLLSTLVLVVQRLLAYWVMGRLVNRGQGLVSTVIIGCTESGNLLADFMLKNADVQNSLLGYFEERSDYSEYKMAGIPYLGNIEDLKKLVREGKVEQVLIALPWVEVERMSSIIRDLRQMPVTLLLVPDMTAFRFAHSRITPVAGLPMFNISDLPLKGWSPFIKRAEDILLSLLALLALSPLMIATAVWVKLDSPGPVLFRQKRYGYNNRIIEVYKFRSMYVEVTDLHAENQTTRDDPRVTRVGRFIRKTSIDELPQLFNVLMGSMSMVGPRPHAKATKAAGILYEDAVDEYTSRHRVKPGITGWAQISGYRGETDTLEKIEKRVAYDLEYIENWSLWFDLYILVLTPIVVLSGKAAY